MKNVGNIIIVQARQTSKRFPNKVLKKIGGRSICEIILKRLKKCKNINKIIFAIPENLKNVQLKEHLKKINATFVLGSEANNLSIIKYTYFECI